MILVGITGKIGCGKTTVSNILKQMGYKVFDSDNCSKNLIQKKIVIKKIEKYFKFKVSNLVMQNGKINTNKLGNYVFENEDELKVLESILHPLIKLKEKKFVFHNAINKEKIVFLDIPLLFQSKAYKRCDYIICTSVSKLVQKQRVLSRNQMTNAKYNNIVAKQNLRDIFIKNKISLSVNTGNNLINLRRKLLKFLSSIKKKKKKCAWPLMYNFYNKTL